MKKITIAFVFASLFAHQMIAAAEAIKNDKITSSASNEITFTINELTNALPSENGSSDDGNLQTRVTGNGMKIVPTVSEPLVAVLPYRLSYTNSLNAYCRLAIKNLRSNKITIVSAPTKSELDQCPGLSAPVMVDLNNDKFPDFVFKTKTKSNKGDFQVAQYLVFLSVGNSNDMTELTYCHSTSISEFLSEEIPFTASKIYSAVKKETDRRKMEIQKCDIP
jgi:hypothetical protein